MKQSKKYYWKGLEQLRNDPEFVKYAGKEFPEDLPLANEQKSGTNRRDFLKMMGFGIATATLAACETPVRKAIPFVNQPHEIKPGIPNYYASTYINKGDYCSIIVKTREGRPIKIEGNEYSQVTKGGVSAQVEASVLDLYDNDRLHQPLMEGNETSWDELDNSVISQLKSINARGGQIRIVSNTILSPSTKSVINDFIAKYQTTQHITYDPQSAYGMILANQRNFGQAVIPSYDFSKPEVIVNFGADFLGTWISPIEFTKDFSKTRKLNGDKKDMSRLYQFESLMSLTGANADYRTRIKPSQEGLVIAKLYNILAEKAGAARLDTTDPGDIKFLQPAADQLWQRRGKTLVLSGSNDPNLQEIVNNINQLLGAYDAKIIDLNKPLHYRQGNDQQMHQFIQDVKGGKIAGVIFLDANPVYDHPMGFELGKGLSNLSLSVSTSAKVDETAQYLKTMAPTHHFLEAWNDAEPKRGHYSLIQPAISPVFNTRQAEESLLIWSEQPEKSYYNYLQGFWRDNFFNNQNATSDFQSFWDKALYNGVYDEQSSETETMGTNFASNLTFVANKINQRYLSDNSEWELSLYFKTGIGNGTMANNPWLQEMPDPISRVTWDNYITIPQSFAREIDFNSTEGSTYLMNLQWQSSKLDIPMLEQPGQAANTLGLALGYGRTHAGPVAKELGINAYPLVQYIDGAVQYQIFTGISINPTRERYQLAQTQTHHTYMGRETVIQESILPEYQQDPYAGRYQPKLHTSEGDVHPEAITLWMEHDYENHHWGLIVDMNSCTGCGACTIACQAENNVPVVGKQEVINRREMHWIRIDRYYSSDAPADDYKALEDAAENPEVIFQPVMCQHCNNAPCETVCPVVATTHSTEGLNQMTYNRCIGTRYCANNCPYKVRRFNWFKYHDNEEFKDVNRAMYDDLGKMVLNPDVTVRSRGVMEKCSFCVQRIQYGKLQAKKEGRRPIDGEINTACVKACPAEALVFGDMNNPDSKISKHLGLELQKGTSKVKVNEPRAYNMLAEINVRPNVYYLTKVKNKEQEQKEA